MTNIIYFPDKNILAEKIKNLPKKDITLKMVDFDDTIFSRYEQLHGTDENSILLQKNRGNKWNEMIKSTIWIENMINQYYKDKKFPQTIVEKMNPAYDVILTAGFEDIQQVKIQATKLEYFPLVVVEKWEDKPQNLIEYIISLGYIPEKVEIYEDRPQNFEASKEEFEAITGAKMDIFFVEMENNETEPKITKL